MQFINTSPPTNSPTTAAPDSPQPQPSTQLTPEAVVEQLRAIRSQIAQVTPITPDQRRQLRYLATTPPEVVDRTINMMDFSSPVQQVLGSSRPTFVICSRRRCAGPPWRTSSTRSSRRSPARTSSAATSSR